MSRLGQIIARISETRKNLRMRPRDKGDPPFLSVTLQPFQPLAGTGGHGRFRSNATEVVALLESPTSIHDRS